MRQNPFPAPYKFRKIHESFDWGHTEWTATGSAAHEDRPAYVEMPAGEEAGEDVQMDAEQLPVYEHAAALQPEMPAEDDVQMNPGQLPEAAADPAPAVEVQEWSKRWHRRADGSWCYVYKKLKRPAAPAQPN